MGNPPTDGRTALVVLVPEAEEQVGALRAAHDPSAAHGVPAHVTILVPFVPATAWSPSVDARLAALFAGVAAFDAEFRRTERFGETTLYLAPEPPAPFVALTQAVAAAFPEHPPYAGAFSEVVPHLTVADGGGRAALDAVGAALREMRPIRTHVREVTLLEERGGTWHVRALWPLGAPDARPTPKPAASADPRTARFPALCAVMERLRAPDGCPWDKEQTIEKLWPYLREELEEAAAAWPDVESGALEPDELREEIGDLLFNVVFVTELCRERGWFSMADVVAGSEAKIRRRHPHIWGDLTAKTPEEVMRIWNAVKAEEKAEKARRRARREGRPPEPPAGGP